MFFCCNSLAKAEAPVSPVNRRQLSTIRAKLVRCYDTRIELEYYIDKEHELGKGGCGIVVVGEHKETRAQYAIKIVNKSNIERGRLDREIKLLKDVDHTNIVRLFSVYDVPGYMYFVMELCLGGHLGNLLSRQPSKCANEKWAKKLFRQLISAIAHLHSRGIAHRDIKLQNILVDSINDRTAQLKLIDFGYGSRFTGALPMRTKCGTPYTTAPEVIRECYDERCDVWSAGVVLYIILSGRRPFEAVDIAGPLSDAGKAAMITNILAGRYHFNHKQWQNVSREGIQFVKSLLTNDYRQRMRAHEALENPWVNDPVLHDNNQVLLTEKSSKVVDKLLESYKSSPMKKAGMLALVFGLSSRAANDLRSVFQSIDTDASGCISRVEFHHALNIIAPDLSPEDINNLFDMVDIDHSQTITFTEFLVATLDPREVDIEELNKAFLLLDEDGNGYISKDEMRKVLHSLVMQNQDEQSSKPADKRPGSPRDDSKNQKSFEEEIESRLEEIFRDADLNHDERISYDEFIVAMTGGNSNFLTRRVFSGISLRRGSKVDSTIQRGESGGSGVTTQECSSSTVGLVTTLSSDPATVNPTLQGISTNLLPRGSIMVIDERITEEERNSEFSSPATGKLNKIKGIPNTSEKDCSSNSPDLGNAKIRALSGKFVSGDSSENKQDSARQAIPE